MEQTCCTDITTSHWWPKYPFQDLSRRRRHLLGCYGVAALALLNLISWRQSRLRGGDGGTSETERRAAQVVYYGWDYSS
jgi:hypothetical protein